MKHARLCPGAVERESSGQSSISSTPHAGHVRGREARGWVGARENAKYWPGRAAAPRTQIRPAWVHRPSSSTAGEPITCLPGRDAEAGARCGAAAPARAGAAPAQQPGAAPGGALQRGPRAPNAPPAPAPLPADGSSQHEAEQVRGARARVCRSGPLTRMRLVVGHMRQQHQRQEHTREVQAPAGPTRPPLRRTCRRWEQAEG